MSAQQEFINEMLPVAEEVSRDTGIPVSVIIGQAALESGWGQHTPHDVDTGADSNNLFGIKHHNSARFGYVEAEDGEPYRRYASREESIRDYGRFITENPRYSEAFSYTHDPVRFLREVERAGYAEDPEYGNKVVGLMHQYDLLDHDAVERTARDPGLADRSVYGDFDPEAPVVRGFVEEVADANTVKLRFMGETHLFDQERATFRPLYIDVQDADAIREFLEHTEVVVEPALDDDGDVRRDAQGRYTGIFYVENRDSDYVSVNRSLLASGAADTKREDLLDPSTDLETQELIKSDLIEAVKQERADAKTDRDLKDDREQVLGSFDPETEVRIGDNRFRIPPSQISVTTINENTPTPILRNKTTLQGADSPYVKQVQLTIYFNGLDDINGYPTTADRKQAVIKREIDGREQEILPDYYVNGLRTLLAQFMVTPFLPIENSYINDAHGISAVTLQNFTASTVPDFPEVLEVELTVMEFNYQAFIDTSLPFGATIHWPLFRFHYQRLLEGTDMAHDGTQLPYLSDFDSEDFTFKTVTAEALQELEDAKKALAETPREEQADYERGESSYEKMVHDTKLLEAGLRQEELFRDDYLDELIRLEDSDKEGFELRSRREEVLKNFREEAQDLNEVNDELIYNPFSDYNNRHQGIRERTFKPYKSSDYVPIFTVPLRHDGNRRFVMEYLDQEYEPYEGRPDNPIDAIGSFIANIPGALDSLAERLQETDPPTERMELEWPSTVVPEGSLFYEWFYGTEDDVEEPEEREEPYEPGERYYVETEPEFRTREYFVLTINDTAAIREIIDRGEEKLERRGRGEDVHTAFHIEDLETEAWSPPDLHLENISVSLSNRVNALELGMQTAPVHQYLGSEEVVIGLRFTASSEVGVEHLSAIFDEAKANELRYSHVVNQPLIRFENPVADLFDLDGVALQDYNSSTIPNYPGAFEIDITLIGFKKAPDDFETLNRIYAGETGVGDRVTIDYFELMEQLAEVNLYPDLELPRYSELPVNSHLYAEDEKYVDPDFYMLKVGDEFREHLAEILEDEREKTMRAKDLDGNVVEVTTNNKRADVLIDAEPEVEEYEPGMYEESIADSVLQPVKLSERSLPYNGDILQPQKVSCSRRELLDNVRMVARQYGIPAHVLQGYVLQHWYQDETLAGTERYFNYFIDGPHTDGFILLNADHEPVGELHEAEYVGPLLADRNKFSSTERKRQVMGNILHSVDFVARRAARRYNRLLHERLPALRVDVEGAPTTHLDPELTAALADRERLRDLVWTVAFLKKDDVMLSRIIDRSSEELSQAAELIRHIRGVDDSYRLDVNTLVGDLEEILIGEEDEPSYTPGVATRRERFLGSCHDMLEYDRRGRLLRAFPTFYMLLIDEGKEAFWWRLQDNFYEYNGVQSIEHVRSRKQVADTCMVTLSNLTGNLTDPYGGNPYSESHMPEMGFVDVLTELIPFAGIEEQEEYRDIEPKAVQLEAGARLHLRVGYGSSPENLPVLFNGMITELELGEEVTVVAQGDGRELTRPIDAGPDDASAVNEPQDMMKRVLHDRDGWLNEIAYYATRGRLGHEHPLGIEHFGKKQRPSYWNEYFDRQYADSDDRYPTYEISQNVFPAHLNLNEDEVIPFTMFLYGKTPWDVFQACAMSVPNYVSAVHPFDYRSTLFFGHPNWDFAYGYDVMRDRDGHVIRDADGNIPEDNLIEKRKTFRQLHFYNSFTDIIDTQTAASAEDVYTVVRPIAGVQQHTDAEADYEEFERLYVDRDIWPELQREVTVDTSINAVGPLRQRLQRMLPYQKFMEVAPVLLPRQDREVAKRIGSAALRDYVQEMYQDPIIVYGDPTVKPYDYIHISDLHKNLHGLAEVEQVVNVFSKESGFVTSVTPDPVTVVNEGAQEDIEFLMWARSISTQMVGYSVGLPLIKSLGQYFLHKTAIPELARQGYEYAKPAARYAQDLLPAVKHKLAQAGQSLKGITPEALKTVGTAGAAVVGSVGWKALAVIAAAGALTLVTTDLIQTLRDKRERREVLTIAPLTKDGVEFTAGINGHEGAVITDDPSIWDRMWHSEVANFFLGESRLDTLREEFEDELQRIEEQALEVFDSRSEQLEERTIHPYKDREVRPDSFHELDAIEHEDRQNWNEEAREMYSEDMLSIVEYKGEELHEYLAYLLSRLEEEVGQELEISTEPLTPQDAPQGTNLLYGSGLAVRVLAEDDDGEEDFILKNTVFEEAYMSGFKAHGMASGDGYVHLDLGPQDRWQVGDVPKWESPIYE